MFYLVLSPTGGAMVITTVGVTMSPIAGPGVTVYIPEGEFTETYLQIKDLPLPKLGAMVEVSFNPADGKVFGWRHWGKAA